MTREIRNWTLDFYCTLMFDADLHAYSALAHVSEEPLRILDLDCWPRENGLNTKPVSVGHVCIEVSNITKSRKFYEPVLKNLGSQTIMEEKDSIGFSNGLLSIFLGQPASKRVERKAPDVDEFVVADHIALLVPDRKAVNEVALAMKNAGFEPLFAAEEHPEFVVGYYSVSFCDPDNNVIEFYVVEKR